MVLAGLPPAGADLSPVWFRELEVVGAYTSGMEQLDGDRRPAFDIAADLAAAPALAGIVGGRYPLSRWRDALGHAFDAGRLGTFKVTFDPREG